MQHVVTSKRPVFRSATGRFEVRQVLSWQDNLVWLLTCLRTGATAVVDGPEAESTQAELRAHGLTLSHVLTTHTHPDHIGIHRELAEQGLLDGLEVYGARKMAEHIPGLKHPLDDGDEVTVGALRGHVLMTEGHIEGHLAYVFDDVVFSGDALFAAGCGRVFTGDHVAMYAGLSKLARLDPASWVCCAHEYTEDGLRFARSVEPDNRALRERCAQVAALRQRGECAVPSQLSEELATNPFLRAESPELIEQVRRQSPEGTPLASPLEVFTATRKLKDTGRYKA